MKRIALAVAAVALWATAAALTAEPNAVHFHHFHLNVTNPQKSMEFYRSVFGAVPVKFGGRADAVFTERSFILFSQVAAPARASLDTGIWHLGWGGVDGPNEFKNLTARGVEFQTPVTPYANFHYMYPYGPDKEVLEIRTGYQNHLYGHVHLIAADPVATVRWYSDNLGITLRAAARGTPGGAPPAIAQPSATSAGSSALSNVDNVQIIVFRQPNGDPLPSLWGTNPPLKTFDSTRGHVVDHIAFSYTSIKPVFDRLKKAGVSILEPIALRPDYGFKSFFVQGPDKVVIEIVEAKPIPDASWGQ